MFDDFDLICAKEDCKYLCVNIRFCRSQWPRGLRRRSAAAETVGSNPTGGMDSIVSVACCQVDVTAMS